MYNWSNKTRGYRTCILCGASFNPREHSLIADICPDCRAKEQDRVNHHLRRAEAHGVPATLTLLAWLQTLQDFNGLCAYCEEHPFTELEHFVPLKDGGGTTADNCVPACKVCNRGKGTENPGAQPGLPGLEDERRQRVKEYLEGRQRNPTDEDEETPPPYNWIR
jgi:5-methylcytosine-specific restriction endonuclease McrA